MARLSEPRPVVVVVGGPPGSGKTTLSRALADGLHVPVVNRDFVKTGLHVSHRSTDPAEQRRFADAAFSLAFTVAGTLLDGGCSVVLEAAFHRDHSGPPLVELLDRPDVVSVVLWTRCPPTVTVDRYRRRASGRHPAHNDGAMVEEMADPGFDWARYDPPPELEGHGDGGGITWVETADGCRPSIEELVASIEARLG